MKFNIDQISMQLDGITENISMHEGELCAYETNMVKNLIGDLLMD